MTDDEAPDVEIIESEAPGGENIKVVNLDTPAKMFYIAKEDTLPGKIVLVNFAYKLGFALSFEDAHHLSHLIHDGLEALTGGDLHEDEDKEDTPVILH